MYAQEIRQWMSEQVDAARMALRSAPEGSVEYAEEYGRLSAFEDMMDRLDMPECVIVRPGVAIDAAARVGLSRESLLSKCRRSYLNDRRQVVMWYLRTCEHWGYRAIGEAMCRDHTTVVHGVKRVSELLSCGDKVFTELTKRISDGQ